MLREHRWIRMYRSVIMFHNFIVPRHVFWEFCTCSNVVPFWPDIMEILFRGKIEESRLCPELDSFRRQLWGDSSFTMPKALEPRPSDLCFASLRDQPITAIRAPKILELALAVALCHRSHSFCPSEEDLLGVAVLSGPGTSEALAACTQPQAAVENEDFAPPDMADGMAEFSDAADGSGASAMAASPPKGKEKPLPLVDMSASQVLAAPASSKDDVVAGWFQTCSDVSYFSQYVDVFGIFGLALQWLSCFQAGVSINGGTPSYHPFRLGLSLINHPFIGVTPMAMETPKCFYQRKRWPLMSSSRSFVAPEGPISSPTSTSAGQSWRGTRGRLPVPWQMPRAPLQRSRSRRPGGIGWWESGPVDECSTSEMGASIVMGVPPIAGWFIMEKTY